MAKQLKRPLTPGGRTMAKMGRKPGSSHSGANKKATWYQLGGVIYGSQAKMGSWPVGEMPAEIVARMASKS